MIRAVPYYQWSSEDSQREFERNYLRMVAAVTPFFAEDVLYDDPEGLACCVRVPKERCRIVQGKQNDTAIAKLLKTYRVKPGDTPLEQLTAEAVLAERIAKCYSQVFHDFLYQDSTKEGQVNRKNLRELLLLRLQPGKVPKQYQQYRYDHDSKSSDGKLKKRHAKALYEYVYPYGKFSQLKNTNGHIGIHDFVSMLDVKVCPYCNRIYTTTVNTGKQRVRPQLDHFHSKNHYPFLALSINNLIPVCSVCNLLKLDTDEDLIYPYEESFADESHVFTTNIPVDHTVPALEGIAISEDDFEIKMKYSNEIEDKDRRKRIKTSIETLALEELYQSHREYVSYLYRQRYILTNLLAQDLFKQFPNLFSSEKDVESLFALMNIDREHWGDRPLAKLTHDILAEIDLLYFQTSQQTTDPC